MKLRRSTHDARVEMAPLLDVIFLLLTIFIFAQAMSMDRIKAEFLPVTLPRVVGGAELAERNNLFVTFDAAGQLYLNREPITRPALIATLEEVAGSDNPPNVLMAAEDQEAAVDRLPIFIDIVQACTRLGLTFHYTGRPGEAPPR